MIHSYAFACLLAALPLLGGSVDPSGHAPFGSASPDRDPAPQPVDGGRAGGPTVFLTVDEALKLAFPDLEVTRGDWTLTPDELTRAKKLADTPLDRSKGRRYTATRDGKLVGTAYLDNHKVRSLRETVLIVVTPEAALERIEVLSFGEPVDYLPRKLWYRQFATRKLDPELRLERGIRRVAGATLTAEATTSAARRVLAIHQVLEERP